jgi:UDP-N-acetylglucosamine acyltransferase
MSDQQIHPSAIVAPGAQLGAGVIIGPYCVIGEHVRLGDGTHLEAHVVVDGHTTVGAECHFFPFACVGMQTQDLKFKGGESFVEIGAGTTLREYVTVHSATAAGGKTVIGEKAHILAYAHIAHDCVVGNRVIISNAGTLAGHVLVEDQAVIGGCVAIHQFVRIGKMAMIGGCSKVVQDAPPFMISDGHPSAVRAVNKVALERNGVPEEVQKQLRQAHRLLFRENLNLGQAVAQARQEIPTSEALEHLLKFVESSERGIGR